MIAFVVAAPSTGAGKTTVALALMAAYRSRGFNVQPFKVGPDYIDPAFHAAVCGRPSINLDSWMTPDEFVRDTFARHAAGAGVAVIEGVMGLFDGADDTHRGSSTAHIARLLDVPILLVLDGWAASESLAAVLLGCEQYDPDLRYAGCVLNRSGSTSHTTAVESAIRSRCRTPLIGAIPNRPQLSIPERQLGLTSVLEHPLTAPMIDELSALPDESLLNALNAAATFTAPPRPPSNRDASTRARIGVAYDAAFCFYYEDNLRLLREAGADLTRFSPLGDSTLPEGIQGLYLGGGFPEAFAAQLAENRTMLDAIRSFPGPIWAECGGLILLCENFLLPGGHSVPMAGRVPGTIEMTDSLQGFGYRDVRTQCDGPLGPAGAVLRGHEFHWSRWASEPPSGSRLLDSNGRSMGFGEGQVAASYFHAHLGSNPAVASNFVDACAKS